MSALALRIARRTFRSLRRHRNYRLFFSGQVVSLIGTWMQNIALAWLVIELSGSALAVGALAFCRFLPFLLFGLVAGVVVDRFDSRRLLVVTQGVAMIVSVVLAVVTLADVATLPVVYALAAPRRRDPRRRRARAADADLPDGRSRRAAERRCAQLRALQRITGDRAGDRRAPDRRRRDGALLRDQRGQLPRRPRLAPSPAHRGAHSGRPARDAGRRRYPRGHRLGDCTRRSCGPSSSS